MTCQESGKRREKGVFKFSVAGIRLWWEFHAFCGRVHKLKTGTHFELPLRFATCEDLGIGPQRRDSLDEY